MADAHAPFLVDDDTGVAYVDPADAEVRMRSGDQVEVDAGEEPPAYVRDFLVRETDLSAIGSRRRKYSEVRIDVGDAVTVVGQADPDAVAARDDPVTTAITRRGDAPRFFVSDDPDYGLGRRLIGEIVVFFLVAAILLSVAGVLAVG